MKYRNQKTQGFDSKREFRRFQELQLLEKIGAVSDLKTQVRFELIASQRRPDGKMERPAAYIADFCYLDDQGKRRVEDAKGFRTREYVLKRKLMLLVHGIGVEEV